MHDTCYAWLHAYEVLRACQVIMTQAEAIPYKWTKEEALDPMAGHTFNLSITFSHPTCHTLAHF